MTELLDLTPLLNPRSVAIIGATADVRRPGGRPLDYLQRFGYPGRIYPVNPKRTEIAGVTCYPDVASLPEVPDMAVIVLPAAAVHEAMAACQKKGIPAMTVFTSGFSEMGAKGRALEDRIKVDARAVGSIMCGPNCQGVANFNDRMVANFTSAVAEDVISGGGIGFASQSGLFGGILTDECRRRGLGLGYLVSTGNEAVVDVSDVIAYCANDPRTSVIAGYIEGIRDGEKFRVAAQVASDAGKPVVMLKVGRTAEAAAAAASHTASMAGSYAVYRAAFRQWGVLEVDDIDELVDTAETFDRIRRMPRGDRICVLGNSGGVGVFCADKVVGLGLRMAQLAPDTVAAIEAKLPGMGSARNPVDVALQAFSDPVSVGSHLRHILADENVDVAVAVFGIQRLCVDEMVEEFRAAQEGTDKPIVVAWMGGDPKGPEKLKAAGIPTFTDPLRALKAVRKLIEFSRRQPSFGAPAAEGACGAAKALVADHVTAGRKTLGEHASKAVLEAAGIATTREVLVRTEEETAAAAEEIGFPVVLKIESADITHKTEVGGVALGLGDADAVRKAVAAMTERVLAARPDARIDGFTVQEMVTDAVEMIVGIKRDPTFGPTVLVGSGGILVEILADSALRVAPFDHAQAEAMVKELAGYSLLAGARGKPPADVDALVDALVKVSALAAACPEIEELDINPLMVLPEGRGVRAADGVIGLG